MRNQPYNFEIMELMTMFAAAFDDIVIKRYDNDRVAKQELKVQHKFSPKSRLIMDLVNKESATNLPIVCYTYTTIKYNTGRERNKFQPFYAKGKNGGWLDFRHVVPIDISVSLTVFTKDSKDLTQIIQNFGVNVNPYCSLVWRIPHPDQLESVALIHVPVIWDGTITTDLNVEKADGNKGILTAETSFTIQGWWFRGLQEESAPIYDIFAKYAAIKDFPLIIDGEDDADTANTDEVHISYLGPVIEGFTFGQSTGAILLETDGTRKFLAFEQSLALGLQKVYLFVPSVDDVTPFPAIPGFPDKRGVELTEIDSPSDQRKFLYPESVILSGDETIIPSDAEFTLYILFDDGLAEANNLSLPE